MKTTQLQKQKASTGKDIGKLSSSMLHSIRHESQYLKKDDNGKEIKMWDKSKSHLNFMLLGGVMVSLDSLSDEKKEDIVTDMIKDELADLSGENLDKELIQSIETLNKKVKKQASNLKRNGGLIAEFSGLKDSKITDETLEFYKEKINEDPDIKRTSQKFKSMENFQQDNNALIELRDKQKDFKIDKNQGLIQESFLKFPQMPNGTISKEKHTEILEGYYKDNFPDYKIKGSFYHGDERSDNDNLDDCGGHPHTFISCKNSKTGKYDLIKQQKLKAVEYIKNNPDNFPSIDPEKLKTSYNLHKSPKDADGNIIKQISAEHKAENREMTRYMRALGQASQSMILEYGQEQLKNEGIELFRNAYDTKDKKQRLAELEADSKLPKHERIHNSHNQEFDDEERKLKKLKNQNEELIDTNKRLGFLISGQEASLEKLEQKFSNLHRQAMGKTKYDVNKYVDENTEDLKNMVDYLNQPEMKEKMQDIDNDKNWFKAFEMVDEAIEKPDSVLSKVHKIAKNIPGYLPIFNKCKDIFFNEYKNRTGEKHKLDTGTGTGGGKLDDIKNGISKLKNNSSVDNGLTEAQINEFYNSKRDEDEQKTSKKSGTFDADDFIKLTNDNIREKYKK